MKIKKIGALISALLCVSLVSVGFASWIITGDATSTSEEGTIVAEGITDNTVKIANMAFGKETPNDAQIVFGAPASPAGTNNVWLKPSAAKEDLKAVLTVTFEDGSVVGDVTAELVPTQNTANYDKAISNNVIIKNDIPRGRISGNTCTITVTFSWGKAFNNENPYYFYNNKAIGDNVTPDNITAKAHALKYMPFVEGLSSVKYKLKVTATSKTQ